MTLLDLSGLSEALRDDLKQVAEGVMNLNEKFDREISSRFTALQGKLENLKRYVEKIERSSSIS